ncbi:MAG: hypothetical protein Q7V02_01760 [Methylophilus sp.]|nr:hypothetical protein [Methylophilus sp.]
MKFNNLKITSITKLALLLLLTVAITACAAIPKYGSSSTSWKEEVVLHDGQTMIVKRTTKRSGGLQRPEERGIIYKSLVFTLPNSRQAVTWEDKETEDIRSSNFQPLLLDIVENTPYLVTTALGCLSYNKWGRPNPPYIIFKYDSKAWQRIALQELPAQLTTPNLLINSPDTVAAKSASNLISAATIKSLNSDSIHKEYKNILREAIPKAGGRCPEMIHDGKGGWHGVGWFKDNPSLEACVSYCDRQKISAEYCPCNKFFKGN